VIALSGRAIEAAGDVNVLLLDKTGTITLGNRQAAALIPVSGHSEKEVAEAVLMASLTDETPEGRSIVVMVKQKYDLRMRELPRDAELIPFSAETRISGVNIEGQVYQKGAADAIRNGDFSAKYLRAYENSWRQLIGFDLKAMAYLRRLLYRLPDENLDRIFGLANDLGADKILNTSPDIDFQGRTLLGLARDPRMFITLLSASVLSAPSLIRD
jgi:magnesium-transporting ATPase (P-type)